VCSRQLSKRVSDFSFPYFPICFLPEAAGPLPVRSKQGRYGAPTQISSGPGGGQAEKTERPPPRVIMGFPHSRQGLGNV